MNDIMKKLNELENDSLNDSKDKLLEKSAQTIEYLEMKIKSLEAELKHLRSNIKSIGSRYPLSDLDNLAVTDQEKIEFKEHILQDMLKEVGIHLYKEGFITVRETPNTVFTFDVPSIEIELQVYKPEEVL